MKCPSCQVQCLANDVRCPYCHRLLSGVMVRSRSAMWITTPLFLAIGIGVFVYFPIYEPRGTKGIDFDWMQANVATLVGGGSALIGAFIGWLLDWIAQKG